MSPKPTSTSGSRHSAMPAGLMFIADGLAVTARSAPPMAIDSAP